MIKLLSLGNVSNQAYNPVMVERSQYYILVKRDGEYLPTHINEMIYKYCIAERNFIELSKPLEFETMKFLLEYLKNFQKSESLKKRALELINKKKVV